MKTNNSSGGKIKDRNKNMHENTNEKKMSEMTQNTGTNKMYGVSQSNSDTSAKSSKGTGMSSEAGSSQTEESWQGTGGSQSGMPKKEEGNKSYTGKSSETLNTDNIKNQSDQQRRSSMGDGTPEMDERELKNQRLPDEELDDVDWSSGKSKNK
jgi:hypothetical protein